MGPGARGAKAAGRCLAGLATPVLVARGDARGPRGRGLAAGTVRIHGARALGAVHALLSHRRNTNDQTEEGSKRPGDGRGGG
jgi:hypothetical protein